ncbi:MAG: hypothetical protein IMW98_02465 [Firmicutes bacterium]|nr:hypothetical protein [Bacillota bacterium]
MKLEPESHAARPKRKVSVHVVEDLIRELPAVLDARLVVNPWGGVEEVHVLADRTRPAKGIVRDVESALMARWGLRIDRKKISVAQVRGLPPADKFVRVKVTRLSLSQDTVAGRVRVELEIAPEPQRDRLGRIILDPEIPEGPWHGRAEGPSLGDAARRVGAEALLAALNQALQDGHWLECWAVETHEVGAHPVVTALVLYRMPRGRQQLLCGSVVLKEGDDAVQAGIRAAMDATNRIFGRAMRRALPRAAGAAQAAGAAGAGSSSGAPGTGEPTQAEREAAAAGEAGGAEGSTRSPSPGRK